MYDAVSSSDEGVGSFGGYQAGAAPQKQAETRTKFRKRDSAFSDNLFFKPLLQQPSGSGSKNGRSKSFKDFKPEFLRTPAVEQAASVNVIRTRKKIASPEQSEKPVAADVKGPIAEQLANEENLPKFGASQDPQQK